MQLQFPQQTVGQSLVYHTITVFPLFSDATAVPYALSIDALKLGETRVTECGKNGSVPELLVVNGSPDRVLFLEGEHLEGARQDRVLNTSVLVSARSETIIPVSCVESGRWRQSGRAFSHGKGHSSRELRRTLKRSVSDSLRRGRRHSSDQSQVWRDVAREQSGHGVHSRTGAMHDTYKSLETAIEQSRQGLSYVNGSTGLAIYIGGEPSSVDLFDRADTCAKVWDRMIAAAVVEGFTPAHAESPRRAHPPASHVLRAFDALKAADWKQVKPVGEGAEFRTTTVAGNPATALFDGENLVHASLVV